MTNGETVADLACGAAVGPLLEQAVDHPGVRTDHQQTCVHCQAALAEFETLWLPVRESAATTPLPPPDLVARIIHRIRSALASPGWALIHQDRGVTRVTVELIVKVIRDAAQSVRGVRSSLVSVDNQPAAARPQLTRPRPEQVDVELGVSGSTVAVQVTVAVDYGPNLLELATAIRRQVQQHAEAMIGITVATVSVRIDDIIAPT